MSIPGFTADLSLNSLQGGLQISRRILSSGNSIGQVYPARLKNEDEGVNCDSCVGAQCAELNCLGKSLGNGGVFDPGGGGGDVGPCLGSHWCSGCFPSGPSIFSPGRQFCIDSFCSPGFGGKCTCQVFKGFQSCQLPTPVFTTGRKIGLRR